MLSLRIAREQHVPDSSNQSPCLIKLFSFVSPEGNFGGNQQPDGPIRLSSTTTTTTTTQHQHTMTTTQQHTTRRQTQRERHRKKDRERKRRNPSQACFTIFRVLTCVLQSLSNHGLFIYILKFHVFHAYIYMYIHISMYIYTSKNMSMSLIFSFLTKKKTRSGTRTFHDVYCSKPLTCHNG